MGRVAYICGMGHSGSTLLDYVIGSLPEVFSTGELWSLPWQLDRGRDESEEVTSEQALDRQDVCSCLRNFRACPAWSGILEELSRRAGFDVAADPYRFRIAMLHGQRRPQPGERRVGGFFTNRLPRLLFYSGIRRRGLSPLAALVAGACGRSIRNNWLLFDTIADVTARPWVADSSKDVCRFLLLHRHRPGDIRVLLLVRGIGGYALSRIRRGVDPVPAARHWVAHYNRALSLLRSVGAEYRLVQYEDLVGDPEAQRARIAEFLGISAPAEEVGVLDPRDNHLVKGNRMRYRGPIHIRYDDAWRERLDEPTLGKLREATVGLDEELRGALAGMTSS